VCRFWQRTINPASRSVGLAPLTQITRGFHDARMARLVRGPSGEVQRKGRRSCRFIGRQLAAVADATFRRIDGRRSVEIRGVGRKLGDRERNQRISGFAGPAKEELRRNAGATKPARQFPGAVAAAHLPISILSIGQRWHILAARTTREPGRWRRVARGGRGKTVQRASYTLGVCGVGIIGEFVPGGNAMVVVEFALLIHMEKCCFAASRRQTRCYRRWNRCCKLRVKAVVVHMRKTQSYACICHPFDIMRAFL
jgi:hypothetical protein